MKVHTDSTDNRHYITIHTGESEPTGVIEGSVQITEGDFLINADTADVKIFNGTQWNLYKSGSGE